MLSVSDIHPGDLMVLRSSQYLREIDNDDRWPDPLLEEQTFLVVLENRDNWILCLSMYPEIKIGFVSTMQMVHLGPTEYSGQWNDVADALVKMKISEVISKAWQVESGP